MAKEDNRFTEKPAQVIGQPVVTAEDELDPEYKPFSLKRRRDAYVSLEARNAETMAALRRITDSR